MKKLQILGPGCPKCQQMTDNTEAAVKELNLDCNIEKVTAINEISKFGVMITPALVIDGQVKIVGKVPTVEEIKDLLS